MLKALHFLLVGCVITCSVSAELKPEPIPIYNTLPEKYPDSWVFVHDTNFFSLVTGRLIVLDVAAKNHEYKGALDAGQFASFIESKQRNELYVAETFYSRVTRGDRTDVVSVYDKSNLKLITEIALPDNKRGQVVTNKYTMQLIDNDNYLLIFNFTPAASVVVIDVDTKAILNEVQIPGCSMIYPSGPRGFSSLCSNGSLITTSLARDGSVVEQKRLPQFFDVDKDPLFDKPAYYNETAYHPSFLGMMQPINYASATPVIEESWSLLSAEDQAENWRPSGWQIISAHESGKLYVLMQNDGFNGSHKTGGPEVWVYDIKKQKRVQRIVLKSPGFSVEITKGKNPYLVVTNQDMMIDVYTSKGEWIRDITAGAMPFILHATR